jgi:DNA-binding NarL/FixJ family response regulator
MAPHSEATAAVSAILVRLEQNECERLTPRENEVLAMVLGGGSDQQIARSLGIAVKTVRRHAQSAYRKHRASSRAAVAVMYALRIVLASCRECQYQGIQPCLLQRRNDPERGLNAVLTNAKAALRVLFTSLDIRGLKALTPREEEVMTYVLRGDGNKQIAHALGVSSETISTLIQRAKTKLNQPTRANVAVAVALIVVKGTCLSGNCCQL